MKIARLLNRAAGIAVNVDQTSADQFFVQVVDVDVPNAENTYCGRFITGFDAAMAAAQKAAGEGWEAEYREPDELQAERDTEYERRLQADRVTAEWKTRNARQMAGLEFSPLLTGEAIELDDKGKPRREVERQAGLFD